MKRFFFTLCLSFVYLASPFNLDINAQITKSIGKQIVKKGAKNSEKKASKNIAKKAAKGIEKETSRVSKGVLKTTSKKISKSVIGKMTKEIAEVFSKGGYTEINASIKGMNKPLLVSPKFDPYLKVSRKYTGDFDPVKFHKNNPRFVRDGCETNLGRMKRGLAPLYKDPTNKKLADHGYSPFELHHGGQKANPDYFALMAEDHKTSSAILHPKRVGSEINRNEFSKKERAPMYIELAEYIDLLL